MDQRRLRLGDILDDYCPRERRLTNHAVVAMIDEDVKQTRCTTCDAEHVYKGGRVPKRRKKETPGALYKEVLAGMPEQEATPALASPASQNIVDTPAPVPGASDAVPEPNDAQVAPVETSLDDDDTQPAFPVEDGPVHRQLLRAKLPRPEGQKDARPLPEFTVRQSAGRGNGHFRGPKLRGGVDPRAMSGRGNGGSPTGNRGSGSGSGRGGFHGPRPGQHRNPGGRGGSPSGFRGGQSRPGGKKGRG